MAMKRYANVNCRKSFKSREQTSPVNAIIRDRSAVWSNTAGNIDAVSASPTFSTVSNNAKARSDSRKIASFDRINRFYCKGRMAWIRITPILFSMNNTAAIPKNPTAAISKNSSSQVISFLAFCSGVLEPITSAL